MLYNWKIIGHQKVLTTLEREIQAGNRTHAYLFTGPDQVGKFRVAQTLAAILQCPNNFCRSCPICHQIEQGIHLDTLVYADQDESLKIEAIRELIGNLNLTTQSRFKIVLIQNIERLTLEASNSLLKTLEEPPPQVIFLLTTDNPRMILSTIISRVRLYKFGLCSDEFLKKALLERYPDLTPRLLETIISFSFGKAGKAINLLENKELLNSYQNTYNELENLDSTVNLVKKFQWAENLCKDPHATKIFLDVLLHFIRLKLFQAERKPDQETFINLLAEIEQTKKLLAKNINARLALENLMLKI